MIGFNIFRVHRIKIAVVVVDEVETVKVCYSRGHHVQNRKSFAGFMRFQRPIVVETCY